MEKKNKKREFNAYREHEQDHSPFYMVDGHSVAELPNGFDPFSDEVLDKVRAVVDEPSDILLVEVNGFLYEEPNGAVCYDITDVYYSVDPIFHRFSKGEFTIIAPKVARFSKQEQEQVIRDQANWDRYSA